MTIAYADRLRLPATHPDSGRLDREEYLQKKANAILDRTYEHSQEDRSGSSLAALVAVADLRLSDEANSAEIEAILMRGAVAAVDMREEYCPHASTRSATYISDARCPGDDNGLDLQVDHSHVASKGHSTAQYTHVLSGPAVHAGGLPEDNVTERRSDDTVRSPYAGSRHPLGVIQGSSVDAAALSTLYEDDHRISSIDEGPRMLVYTERFHSHAQWSRDANTPFFRYTSTTDMELTWNATPRSVSYRWLVIVADNEQSSGPLQATLEEIEPASHDV
ncbi:hypothetical protein FKP32DRAFT_476033 [Trametes sanguinea]|nr:hypothetical protein FKP32DRAFT_476033 [Trametes sanguinea]